MPHLTPSPRAGGVSTLRNPPPARGSALACALLATAIACALLGAVDAAGARGASPSAGLVARAAQGGDPCLSQPQVGDLRVVLSSGGLQRSAIVHVPPLAAGRAVPLLVALHGAGQSGAFFEGYTGFSTVADGEGFVVAYPDAAGEHPFWSINDSHPGSPDDVRFISDLLDRIQVSLCIDPRRIYATGVSNGGGMAARLGCQLSARLAAIAPVAGGYKSLPACRPVHPVSVVEVHGTSDPTVPYAGTPPGGAGAVPAFLSAWVTLDGCRTRPSRRRVAGPVMRLDWAPCLGGSAVAHLEISGGGHQLPGGLPPDRGQRSTVSAPWEIWSFLRSRVLATGPARVGPSRASAPAGQPANPQRLDGPPPTRRRPRRVRRSHPPRRRPSAPSPAPQGPPAAPAPSGPPSASGPSGGSAAPTATAASAGPGSPQCVTAPEGGSGIASFTVDGQERTAWVHVPSGVAAGSHLPLVVALHGFRSDGQAMERETGFSAMADHERFIVAYPNAPGGRWAIYAGEPRAEADRDFVRTVNDQMSSRWCIDRRRRYVVGVSNGAGEAARVGCLLGDRLAGIGLVAGDYQSLPACHPPRPLSVFEIHGTHDIVVPYTGRASDHSGSVPQFLAMWRRLDHCRPNGTRRLVAANTERSLFRCAGNTRVGALKLIGVGHVWPGTPPAGQIPAPGSAADVLWRFFQSLGRRGRFS